ncbi:MAG: hypothetical protein AAB500_00730 [Patescibacteria group bacterium]
MSKKAKDDFGPIDPKFDPEKYYDENIKPYMESKGVAKMWNYFMEITKTDYFQNFIKEIRAKYGIPENGFKMHDEKIGIPAETIVLPREKNDELREEIIEKICKKYQLHYFDFYDVIEFYIYYNILRPLNDVGAMGLFRVSDVIDEKEEPFGKLFQDSDDMAYPIAIRISPYASQRDLIDFIENKVVWKNSIKFLQNKYRKDNIKIGKIKNKKQSVQERNDFIWQNRHLPRKQIMSLITDKFGYDRTVDYGYIGKIISLEKRKRKEL